ncbi:MAG: hypothetical protein J5528_01630, partial [Firmicutes bacterium]|nr:hypothetical protein [Bacillota bacterium]
ITPVLSVIVTFCLERTDVFEKKKVWLGVIPVFIYAMLYLVMVILGPERGGWRDFYHFSFGGRMYLIPVSGFVMFLATYIISKLGWRIYNKAHKIG